MNPEMINKNEEHINCPECKTGALIKRRGACGYFYGCTNYPYCDYSYDDLKVVENSQRCPNCGHFILWRGSSRGYFLACSNYPRCKYTPPKYVYNIYKPKYNLMNLDKILDTCLVDKLGFSY